MLCCSFWSRCQKLLLTVPSISCSNFIAGNLYLNYLFAQFPVLARILAETHMLDDKVGNIALSSAAVDDVV
jgi:Kef-type K+ transport system membrane component KefB